MPDQVLSSRATTTTSSNTSNTAGRGPLTSQGRVTGGLDEPTTTSSGSARSTVHLLNPVWSREARVPVDFVAPTYTNAATNARPTPPPSRVASGSLYMLTLNRVLEQGSADDVQAAIRWAPPTGGTSDPAFRTHVLRTLARRPDAEVLIDAAIQALETTPEEALDSSVAMATTYPTVWRAVLQARPGPHDEAFWSKALKVIPRDVAQHFQAHPEVIDSAVIGAVARSSRSQLLDMTCAALIAQRNLSRPDADGLTPIDHVLARAALACIGGRLQQYADIHSAPLNVRGRLLHLNRAYQALTAANADVSSAHTRIPARYGAGLDRTVLRVVRAWSPPADAAGNAAVGVA